MWAWVPTWGSCVCGTWSVWAQVWLCICVLQVLDMKQDKILNLILIHTYLHTCAMDAIILFTFILWIYLGEWGNVCLNLWLNDLNLPQSLSNAPAYLWASFPRIQPKQTDPYAICCRLFLRNRRFKKKSILPMLVNCNASFPLCFHWTIIWGLLCGQLKSYTDVEISITNCIYKPQLMSVIRLGDNLSFHTSVLRLVL